MSGLTENRTLQILRRAQEGGYAVNAQVVYDAGQARAYVAACERKRSPGILMLFPVSVEQQGGAFVRYCLDIAHSACVPIAVHLDHATSAAQLELVLALAEAGTAFDSIMVDASHADTDEENIAIARPWVARCNALGIATEVELGRLEGGEAGLREITGAMLTDPAKAEEFVTKTGADILAPSIGNLHGSYRFLPGGPAFDWSILEDLQARFGSAPGGPYLCMHGTDELSDAFFRRIVACGVSKINVNSWLREPYVRALADGLQRKSLPDAIDDAHDAMVREAERFCDLLGSTGKA